MEKTYLSLHDESATLEMSERGRRSLEMVRMCGLVFFITRNLLDYNALWMLIAYTLLTDQ